MDRLEEMSRTTFAGQLTIDGYEAPVTTVAPPQAFQLPEPEPFHLSLAVPLPL